MIVEQLTGPQRTPFLHISATETLPGPPAPAAVLPHEGSSATTFWSFFASLILFSPKSQGTVTRLIALLCTRLSQYQTQAMADYVPRGVSHMALT